MHELPDLPFDEDALEPHISRETIEYHYGKHHSAYVNKLNTLIEGTQFEHASLEDIVCKATGGIFNNGAQAWNHAFYWNCLSPKGEREPSGELAEAIRQFFGSFEEFKKEFTEAGAGLFGSGWQWLVRTPEKELQLVSAPNADNPLRDGSYPLLVCDVWEHAYYIDYRNARPDYLKAYWHIVNWTFVAERFSMCLRSETPEPVSAR